MDFLGTASSNDTLSGPTTSKSRQYQQSQSSNPLCYAPPVAPQQQEHTLGSLFEEDDEKLSHQVIEEAMFLTDSAEDGLLDMGLPSLSQPRQYNDDCNDDETDRSRITTSTATYKNGASPSPKHWYNVQAPFEAEVALDMGVLRNVESQDKSHMVTWSKEQSFRENEDNHDRTLSVTKMPPLTKRRTKKPKPSNHGMPKRPLSPYNLFFQAKRAEILMTKLARRDQNEVKRGKKEEQYNSKNDGHCHSLTQNSDASTSDSLSSEGGESFPKHMLGKLIGKLWRELDPNEKKHFQDTAHRNYERYRREMESVARNRNSKSKNGARVEASKNKDTRSYSVLKSTTSTSSTKPPTTTAMSSNMPSRSTGRLEITRQDDASITNRASEWFVQSPHVHAPQHPACTSISLFPPPPYPVVSPPHLFLPSRDTASGAVMNSPMLHDYNNVVRDVPWNETYPYGHPLPPQPSPTHAYTMAIPPGMEILLKTNQHQNNLSLHGSTVSGGKFHHHNTSRTTNVPTTDSRSPDGDGRMQKYRVLYNSYTMTRTEADSCIDTFLSFGLQAHATTNSNHSTISTHEDISNQHRGGNRRDESATATAREPQYKR